MMKNIYIIMISIVGLFSCQLTDVVDVDPPNNLVPENVATNASTAENLLNGAYSILNNRFYYRFTESVPSLLSGTMQVRTIGDRDIEANAIQTDNINARELWRTFYELINMTNIVIEQINTLPDEDFAGERKSEIIGEAHFLRAFGHFDALRYYGQFFDGNSPLGVMIRTSPANVTTRNQARGSVSAVYDQIIADLDIAIAQAPDFTVSYFASKTAAKALKAKVLLFMGEYADAASLASEVINEGTRSLSPTFAEVFDDGLDADEMIFIKYADEQTADNPLTRRKNFVYGFRWLTAGDFLTDFMSGDPREAATYAANGSVLKVHNTDNFSPTYYLRLAELYLIQAEGLARSGASLADSKAPLEAVRSRAFGTPQVSAATTTEELLDEIYNEIILELSFENGSEWFAGIRFDKIVDAKEQVTSQDQYILPVPLREIQANSELTFGDQNPGYTE